MYEGEAPKTRQDLYYIYRACERFQGWIPSPMDFYGLKPDEQEKVLAYSLIRDLEERELLWLRSRV